VYTEDRRYPPKRTHHPRVFFLAKNPAVDIQLLVKLRSRKVNNLGNGLEAFAPATLCHLVSYTVSWARADGLIEEFLIDNGF
jgi:hypothetical protein